MLVQWIAVNIRFLLTISHEGAGNKCPSGHRHASHIRNILFIVHQSSGDETENTYSESCQIVFKDYCYTLYPLTCCISKNFTDSNLIHKEAAVPCLLFCYKKHSQTTHRIACGVSSCMDLLKKRQKFSHNQTDVQEWCPNVCNISV
jgi:hypothetical protein